jgi:leucyl aminopeptidase
VLRKGAADKTTADVVVIGAVRTSEGPRIVGSGTAVADAFGRRFLPLLSTLGFTGKLGDVTQVPSAGQVKASLILVTGLGDSETPDSLRRAAGNAARALSNAASVALALPADDEISVRAVAEGFRLGRYTYSDYKTGATNDGPSEVVLLTDAARRKDVTDAFEVARVVSEAVAKTRDWVNTPPGDLRPAAFADAMVARNKGRSGARVTVKVLDEKALSELGCGGILGVGQGSDAPPRLVRFTYRPKGAKAHLALVGKGITYDSGGLWLKPSASMGTMKMDMAGAASIANTVFAIADLGLPISVTGFAPMAENMISGSATRPGDVLNMYGGKTVEVLNTDAEGRLVLADSLVLATEAKPDLIVDIATLTGHCVIALGDRVAGVMGNDSDVIGKVQDAAFLAGESVWPLPIPDEMGEKVRGNSKIADLAQHNTERWGGALYAAAFLREFVGTVPWAHIDIAGPAFNEKAAYGHVPSGGTGMGVATLIELARSLAN